MTDYPHAAKLDALAALCAQEGIRPWDDVQCDDNGAQAVWRFEAGVNPWGAHSAGEFGVPLGPEAQMLGTMRMMKAFADRWEMSVLNREPNHKCVKDRT